MDRLMEMKRSGDDDPTFGRVPLGRVLPTFEKDGPTEDELPLRSPDVAADNRVFVPPFLGSRVVKGIALDDIAGYINETALFRNQWQFRPLKGEPDVEFKDRIRPQLREELGKAIEGGL